MYKKWSTDVKLKNFILKNKKFNSKLGASNIKAVMFATSADPCYA